MKKSLVIVVVFILLISLVGCGAHVSDADGDDSKDGQGRWEGAAVMENAEEADALADHVVTVQADSEIEELEKGLSAVRYEGEDGFNAFLSEGGAKTDREVVRFLADSIFAGNRGDFTMNTQVFGCSTISVANAGGGYLFGRNFDWNACDALVITSYPKDGYASVSTVNLDFIRQGAGMAGSEIWEKTDVLIRQMGLEKAKDRLPAQVSGGEAQRAAVARAVIAAPGILFADEPTGALNKANTEEVLDLLTLLYAQGQSVLLVTHDREAALRGNRILYLEDGSIVGELELSPYRGKDREREQKLAS